MNYWIFKANPEQDLIDERLRNPDPMIIWAVTRYHDRIQKGDIVFIWRAGLPRGICAVMEIEASPQKDLADRLERPIGSPATGAEHWVKGRLIQRFPLIDASVIKKIPGLELFSFFSAFQQAVNFTVTRPEGTILLEYIEQHQNDIRENGPKPVLKNKKPAPVRAVSTKKGQAAGAAKESTEVTLLKCETCGRYVVGTDTERHIRETHAGQPVEWKKTK